MQDIYLSELTLSFFLPFVSTFVLLNEIFYNDHDDAHIQDQQAIKHVSIKRMLGTLATNLYLQIGLNSMATWLYGICFTKRHVATSTNEQECSIL